MMTARLPGDWQRGDLPKTAPRMASLSLRLKGNRLKKFRLVRNALSISIDSITQVLLY